MSKNIVVKANILIEASYKLDLVEMRLILLAIIEARESNTLIDAISLIKISAKKYAECLILASKTLIPCYEGLVKPCSTDNFHMWIGILIY